MTEKQLQQECIKYMKDNKILYRKIESIGVLTSSGTMRTNAHAGFSDLIVFKNANIFFIELKTKTGRLNAKQVVFLNQVQQTSQVAICAVVSSFKGFLNVLSYEKSDKVLQGVAYYE